MYLYAVRIGPYSSEGEMKLWERRERGGARIYQNIGTAKAQVTILQQMGEDAHLVTFECLEVPNRA